MKCFFSSTFNKNISVILFFNASQFAIIKFFITTKIKFTTVITKIYQHIYWLKTIDTSDGSQIIMRTGANMHYNILDDNDEENIMLL